MKLSPRTKRILTVLSVLILAVMLTGCTSPVDENGKVSYPGSAIYTLSDPE